MKITYDAYQNTEGDKTDWCVHVCENGHSRLVFFGATKDVAMSKAKLWANGNLDTPERREKIKRLIESRLAGKARKKAAEAA